MCFTFFIFILIPVRTLFAYNWLIMPIYLKRAFPTAVSDNFEFFSNLNPILIFFLAPLCAALTFKTKVHKIMIWGTLIMAAPTFLLGFGPITNIFLLYIVLMTIGEALWSPRFMEYVSNIAPAGRVGAYMGIAMLPWFLTKMIAGTYTGTFLEKFCPETGAQNTGTMWIIFAAFAMISPILLIFTSKWLTSDKKASA